MSALAASLIFEGKLCRPEIDVEYGVVLAGEYLCPVDVVVHGWVESHSGSSGGENPGVTMEDSR